MLLLQNLIWNTRQEIQGLWQLLRYDITFLLALLQPRAVLTARLLAAQSQRAVCSHRIQQKKNPQLRFTPGFHVLCTMHGVSPGPRRHQSGPDGVFRVDTTRIIRNRPISNRCPWNRASIVSRTGGWTKASKSLISPDFPNRIRTLN